MNGRVGRITTSGILRYFENPPDPGTTTETKYAADVAPAPDGTHWLAVHVRDSCQPAPCRRVERIGRLTRSGAYSEYRLTTAWSPMRAIVQGPDGAMWFLGSSSRIGRLTVADWPLPPFRAPRSDFDGDGQSDIVLQNTNGEVAQWQMYGLRIAGRVIASPGTAWQVAESGDFNGDGKVDLLLQNAAGDVAQWHLDGFTILGGRVIASPGSAWKIRATGDLDGDGKDDIILPDSSTGDVAAWLMDGTTIVRGGLVGQPGSSWKAIAAGDFQGDGSSGLLLQDGNGRVQVWPSLYFTLNPGTVVGDPGPTWVAVAAGDYNGDGKSDILLRNSTTGEIAQWQMNGAQIISAAVIAAPGTAWRIAAK